MRTSLILFLLAACATDPAPEPSPAADEGAESESAAEPQPEPEPEPDPEPEPAAEPMGRCHVSCCSAEMLELQRRTAAESGDSSIEQECCFCDE